MVLEILLALSPLVVSALTGWVKTWTPFAALTDAARTPAVRALAAALSFGYVLLGMWFTGNTDAGALNAALNALVLGVLPWLGSMGVFHAFFASKSQ